jgi:hypothetical protein
MALWIEERRRRGLPSDVLLDSEGTPPDPPYARARFSALTGPECHGQFDWAARFNPPAVARALGLRVGRRYPVIAVGVHLLDDVLDARSVRTDTHNQSVVGFAKDGPSSPCSPIDLMTRRALAASPVTRSLTASISRDSARTTDARAAACSRINGRPPSGERRCALTCLDLALSTRAPA